MSAVMHADERNRAMSEALGEDVYHYHLHVVYIPVVAKEIRWTKRCKDKSLVGKVKETIMQVSMSKKWASNPAIDKATGKPLLNSKGKTVLKKSYSVLQDDFFQHMRNAGYTDVERGEYGSSEEHLTVTQFKVKREQERLAQFQEAAMLAQVEAEQKSKEAEVAEKKAARAKAELDDMAPLLRGMEKLAADFSDDPERTLPEAGPLESAKSYREKKAKPFGEKIVKVLRSVYRAYFDLKSKFERLQSAYDREVSKNNSLSARIYDVCAERDSLKGQVRDYERIRRAIGPEQADRILEAAHQQEQAEKKRKEVRCKAKSEGGRTIITKNGGNFMGKHIYDESNGLWYERQGDYYIPCLSLSDEEEQPTDLWGQQRLQYIKKYRKAIYISLQLSSKLNHYLADIDQQAQGVTEVLKAADPMLGWSR